MRVSSNSQYIMGTYNLQNKQFQLNQLGEQLSTMKRINSASDDPVAAASLVDIGQSQAMNDQQVKNALAAGTQLATTDTVLRSASSTIMNIKSLAVQAGNDTLSDANRQAIQGEMRERVKELVALANSTDGSGNYIFGGTDKSQPPFAFSPSPTISVNYVGNQQRQFMAISSSREIAITEPGSSVFGGSSNAMLPASGNELWQSVAKFEAILTTGPASPTYSADINSVINGLDTGLSNLLSTQASIGGRGQEADSLAEMGSALSIQYATQVSNLSDLDFAKATSDFEMAKTALEFTQKTYGQVKGLSLFNYI